MEKNKGSKGAEAGKRTEGHQLSSGNTFSCNQEVTDSALRGLNSLQGIKGKSPKPTEPLLRSSSAGSNALSLSWAGRVSLLCFSPIFLSASLPLPSCLLPASPSAPFFWVFCTLIQKDKMKTSL